MNQQTAFDSIFQVFSNLSGGLITDLSSVITAAITLAIIAMGLDMLSQVFWYGGSDLQNDKWSRNDNAEYQKYKTKRLKQDRFSDRYNWLDK